MRHIVLYVGILIVVFNSCKTTSSNTDTTKKTENLQDGYISLSTDQYISQFVNKKVVFEGKIATIPHQHMMKSSPFGDEKHVYVDYNSKGGQIVAYYREGLVIPKDDKAHKFYGSVSSMSGAGKGGGTHTEYYLDLDKVD